MGLSTTVINWNRYRGVLLPAEPFRDWLNQLLDEARSDYPWTNRAHKISPEGYPLQPEARVAARLGMSPDAFRKLRNGHSQWVSEAVVDRACSYEGSVHIGDLYPQYWAIAEAGGPHELLKQTEAAA